LCSRHCQKDTAAAIRERDADYVLTVTANQAKLHEAWQKGRCETSRLQADMPSIAKRP